MGRKFEELWCKLSRGQTGRKFKELGGEGGMHWGHELNEIKRRDVDGKLSVHFTNGVSVEGIDLLVGADGVRSKTLSLCMNSSSIFGKRITDNISPNPEPLDILLVIGVSSLTHPLLKQRGFHTVDGSSRLFLMPFSEGETMWQFSQSLPHQEGMRLRQSGPSELRKHALSTMARWHSPIPNLIQETDVDTIWGTTLVDRHPLPFCEKGGKNDVVFIGDAAHAMSPFKGAGANQGETRNKVTNPTLRFAHHIHFSFKNSFAGWRGTRQIPGSGGGGEDQAVNVELRAGYDTKE